VLRGRLVAVGQIRDYLAGRYQTDSPCPLTTGIFIRLTAEAAKEEAWAGKERITPSRRVIKDDGSLNSKFPGGLEVRAERRRDEGQTIDMSRKIPRVTAADRHYAKLR